MSLVNSNTIDSNATDTQVAKPRVAFVTGGTRGIGEGICSALKTSGFTVVSNYIGDDNNARAFTERTGIESLKFDVSDFESCAYYLDSIAEKYGAVDVLVNNAGVTRDRKLASMSLEEWQTVMGINLGGTFNTCRLLLPKMIERQYGRIINISSVNGLAGQYGQANYTAAKSGMIGFTKTLALESARHGITANVIAPGYVETDMLRNVPEKVMDKIIANIPVGRLAQVEEVARGVCFLADDAAGFITGSTLSINGGQFLH